MLTIYSLSFHDALPRAVASRFRNGGYIWDIHVAFGTKLSLDINLIVCLCVD